MRVITGFHAVEEKVRSAVKQKQTDGLRILFAKTGPRIKKICAEAVAAGIICQEKPLKEIDEAVKNLPETARDHRGIVMIDELASESPDTSVDFNQFISQKKKEMNGAELDELSIVVILDSVTDPHNVGAVIRSCDQFGCDLLMMPERRSVSESEVIARASAGASAWVPVSVVQNLTRAVSQLKEAGYWVYGADAGGSPAEGLALKGRVALILGSEGSGISRLLKEQCDGIVSIPVCGKIDSLNVSVAAGILLYEIRRQSRATKNA